MSDTCLHLIPTKPEYIPSSLQTDRALSALASAWPDARMEVVRTAEQLWKWESYPAVLIQVITRDKIEFLHGFENLEAVFCPLCESEMDLDAVLGAVSRAYAHDYHDLAFETPCCNSVVSLNGLKWRWAAGFARFSISVMNPDRDIGEESVRRIGEALGCEVRAVWQHV